jgi:uncharacterized tellurite resistance protein B-like protein
MASEDLLSRLVIVFETKPSAAPSEDPSVQHMLQELRIQLLEADTYFRESTSMREQLQHALGERDREHDRLNARLRAAQEEAHTSKEAAEEVQRNLQVAEQKASIQVCSWYASKGCSTCKRISNANL